MTRQNAFINSVNGKPWVNRGLSIDGMDCYGLVILFYRDVLGIELPIPDGYAENNEMSQCWSSEISSGRWETVKRPEKNGLVFTAYRGNTPMHVGIMIDRLRAIHSRGTVENGGKVEIHNISSLERYYGKITFHKYIGG